VSLDKSFFERETNITAKVICDSVSESGNRITTFEIEYPRFILAELNTHKMLEKNSSSSRAIPINKMIEQIGSNMGMPVHWGSNKSGMQAGEELEVPDDYGLGYITWTQAMYNSFKSAEEMMEMGYHKQIANRLLEPFQMMKTVITGTDWDNFFNLRIHPDAQPEFCMLAYKMYQAMQKSAPKLLKSGQWHLPYIHTFTGSDGQQFYGDGVNPVSGGMQYTLEEAQRISASCCAQTSYRKSDDSLEKANKVFDMLINAEVIHSSPFGHLATPVSSVNIKDGIFCDLANSSCPSTWQEGVTHMNRNGVLCSGNLTGWISYRHLIPNNTCYNFNFEERIQTFK